MTEADNHQNSYIIFFAVCSILELEGAISMVFASNLSFSKEFAAFWS